MSSCDCESFDYSQTRQVAPFFTRRRTTHLKIHHELQEEPFFFFFFAKEGEPPNMCDQEDILLGILS